MKRSELTADYIRENFEIRGVYTPEEVAEALRNGAPCKEGGDYFTTDWKGLQTLFKSYDVTIVKGVEVSIKSLESYATRGTMRQRYLSEWD